MTKKEEVIRVLKKKGIDPTSLERELIGIFRKGKSSLVVEEYLRKVIEGVGRGGC